jgi:hypothetical protein
MTGPSCVREESGEIVSPTLRDAKDGAPCRRNIPSAAEAALVCAD